MRRIALWIASVASVAALAFAAAPPPVEAHSFLSHNSCLRHTTYYFDGYAGGKYWYHIGVASGANLRNTANMHASRVAGDPIIPAGHTSYAYGCY